MLHIQLWIENEAAIAYGAITIGSYNKTVNAQ